LDKVGGEGKKKGHDEEYIVLAGAHFVKRGEAIVDQEVGNRNLGVKDDGKGASLDIVREGRDKASGDGGA